MEQYIEPVKYPKKSLASVEIVIAFVFGHLVSSVPEPCFILSPFAGDLVQ
jgi:hypothetical protein